MSDKSRVSAAWLGIALACVGFVGVLAARGQAPAPAAPVAAAAAPAAQTAAVSSERATLDKYCVSCHNDRRKVAGLALDMVNVDQVADNPAVWEKVAHMLRAGAMPPVGMPRPEPAVSQQLAATLEGRLDQLALKAPNPGMVPPHRLNRTEYANAVHDLLGLDISPNLLPADGSFGGFDNQAGVLSVSPLLLERYMNVARQVSRLAIGDTTMNIAPVTYTMEGILRQTDRLNEDLPFGARGVSIKHAFPLEGDYVVKVRLRRNGNEYIRGISRKPQPLDIRLDGVRVKKFDQAGLTKGVPPPEGYTQGELGDAEWEKNALEGDAGLETRFHAGAGSRVLAVALEARRWDFDEELILPVGAGNDEDCEGNIAIAQLEISGPYDQKPAADSLSRQKIFICKPTGEADQEKCATTILTTLAKRAYRRPVTAADTQALMRFCQAGMARGFDGCIQSGLERILASPYFLFRVSTTTSTAQAGTVPATMASATSAPRGPALSMLSAPANLMAQEGPSPKAEAKGEVSRVSDTELASRLSFFLWSSIPDDQLLDVALSGKLREPAVLEKQVRRMLADPRSKSLVDNFAGQWLELRRLETAAPLEALFPTFDGELRDAYKQETERFLESMLQDDRPIKELLTANYTFVNERLAKQYGIPNVVGNRFRKVTVTDPNRIGLLGHGSVLTVTSQGTRTAPVLRGKYMLDNILGSPVPPPPPNIPALKGDNAKGEVLSGRAALEQHRANPTCANCHARMDPWGFALENFDAIGSWREKDGKTPIDPAAVLLDGTKLNGPAGVRQALAARQDQFVNTVTEKLLVYALGRPVEYYDRPALRKITRDATAQEQRWSSVILGVVNSTPFQYQLRGAE